MTNHCVGVGTVGNKAPTTLGIARGWMKKNNQIVCLQLFYCLPLIQKLHIKVFDVRLLGYIVFTAFIFIVSLCNSNALKILMYHIFHGNLYLVATESVIYSFTILQIDLWLILNNIRSWFLKLQFRLVRFDDLLVCSAPFAYNNNWSYYVSLMFLILIW